MISSFPDFTEFTLDIRAELHPLLKELPEGISEFSFANLYLFREAHQYKISKLNDNNYLIIGQDDTDPFFMLPFHLPDQKLLDILFKKYKTLKAASERQARTLAAMGYHVYADRDNFDYLYLREELAKLSGRKFHKKKNLVNAFIHNYNYEGKPLIAKYYDDAFQILEEWQIQKNEFGDFFAAKEAIEKAEQLELCGCIYFVEGKPAAFTMGEEIARGTMFVVHFEKALNQYKGLYQFINRCLAIVLPKKYKYINREQDLGNSGLRQAKMSYRPVGFVKKYRVSV